MPGAEAAGVDGSDGSGGSVAGSGSSASAILGWRRGILLDRAGWRAVGCALLTPFTAVFAYAAVVIGYIYGVLFTLHPLLKRWNYNTVHSADGTTHHVSLEFFGHQLDSWPRWLIPFTAGLLLLAVAPLILRYALGPHRALLTVLLGPDAATRRIRTLEETRARAVDDAAQTLRRIERDLHDGTQARLVALAMHLTLIRELVTAGAEPDRVLTVVDTAQGNATQAISDLRHLVKGIHPPVLDEDCPPPSPPWPPTAPSPSPSPPTSAPAPPRPSRPSPTSAPPNSSPTPRNTPAPRPPPSTSPPATASCACASPTTDRVAR